MLNLPMIGFAFVSSLLSLALLVGVAAWFAFMARTHFHADSPRTPILFALEGLSLALIVGTVVLVVTDAAPSMLRAVLAGVAAVLAGALFRWALIATRRKAFGVVFGGTVPGVLVQSGPYKYIRHPLYLAYVLNWTGCVILAGSVLVGIGVIVIAAMYFYAADSEERDLLRSLHGPAYAEYRKRTGLIIPRFKRNI